MANLLLQKRASGERERERALEVADLTVGKN